MSATFSNGTEFEIWQSRWCDRCEADRDFQQVLDEQGCSILLDALTDTDRKPGEWTRVGLGDFTCSEFSAVSA